MAEEFDVEALAAYYLDLWEKQLAAVSADPELVQMLTSMMSLASMGLRGTVPGFGGSDDGSHSGKGTASAPRTEAVATASRNRDGGVEQLARRLADVEKRLDALEGGTPARGSGTRPRSSKRSG